MAKTKTTGRAANQKESPKSGTPSGSKREEAQGSGADAVASALGQGDLGTATTAAADQVQEKATSLGDQIRQQANDQVATQMDRAASGLEMVAGLLRQAGQQVGEQDQTAFAGSINGMADRVEQWSESLKNQDASQLADETKQFARREPALFVGGALALGFLGVRFFKSSPEQQHTDGDQSASGESALPPAPMEQDVVDDAFFAGTAADYPEASVLDETSLLDVELADLAEGSLPLNNDSTSLEDR